MAAVVAVAKAVAAAAAMDAVVMAAAAAVGTSGGGGERVKRERKSGPPSEGMQRYRIEVGHTHGAKPGNIVGAIANEANISSKNIGSIEIYDNFSTVDLPKDMPKATHDTLQKTRVAGRSLGMREWSEQPPKKRGNPANRD